MTKLMSTQDVADVLGVPLPTFYRWRTEGKGPAGIRVGRRIKFTQAAVDEWLKANTEVR